MIFKHHKKFFQIKWLHDSLKKKKWLQVFGFFAVTWKMISWSWSSQLPHYNFVSILKDMGCPNWVRKEGEKSMRIWDQSTYTIGENAFSLWLWKISSKGSPPHLLWGLAYGVCYRWIGSNTAVKYLALSCSVVLYASWPAAAWAWSRSWFLPAVMQKRGENGCCSPIFLLSHFSLSSIPTK